MIRILFITALIALIGSCQGDDPTCGTLQSPGFTTLYRRKDTWADHFQLTSAIELDADITAVHLFPPRKSLKPKSHSPHHQHHQQQPLLVIGDALGRLSFVADGQLLAQQGAIGSSLAGGGIGAITAFAATQHKGATYLFSGHSTGVITLHRLQFPSNEGPGPGGNLSSRETKASNAESCSAGLWAEKLASFNADQALCAVTGSGADSQQQSCKLIQQLTIAATSKGHFPVLGVLNSAGSAALIDSVLLPCTTFNSITNTTSSSNIKECVGGANLTAILVHPSPSEAESKAYIGLNQKATGEIVDSGGTLGAEESKKKVVSSPLVLIQATGVKRLIGLTAAGETWTVAFKGKTDKTKSLASIRNYPCIDRDQVAAAKREAKLAKSSKKQQQEKEMLESTTSTASIGQDHTNSNIIAAAVYSSDFSKAYAVTQSESVLGITGLGSQRAKGCHLAHYESSPSSLFKTMTTSAGIAAAAAAAAAGGGGRAQLLWVGLGHKPSEQQEHVAENDIKLVSLAGDYVMVTTTTTTTAQQQVAVLNVPVRSPRKGQQLSSVLSDSLKVLQMSLDELMTSPSNDASSASLIDHKAKTVVDNKNGGGCKALKVAAADQNLVALQLGPKTLAVYTSHLPTPHPKPNPTGGLFSRAFMQGLQPVFLVAVVGYVVYWTKAKADLKTAHLSLQRFETLLDDPVLGKRLHQPSNSAAGFTTGGGFGGRLSGLNNHHPNNSTARAQKRSNLHNNSSNTSSTGIASRRGGRTGMNHYSMEDGMEDMASTGGFDFFDNPDGMLTHLKQLRERHLAEQRQLAAEAAAQGGQAESPSSSETDSIDSDINSFSSDSGMDGGIRFDMNDPRTRKNRTDVPQHLPPVRMPNNVPLAEEGMLNNSNSLDGGEHQSEDEDDRGFAVNEEIAPLILTNESRVEIGAARAAAAGGEVLPPQGLLINHPKEQKQEEFVEEMEDWGLNPAGGGQDELGVSFSTDLVDQYRAMLTYSPDKTFLRSLSPEKKPASGDGDHEKEESSSKKETDINAVDIADWEEDGGEEREEELSLERRRQLQFF